MAVDDDGNQLVPVNLENASFEGATIAVGEVELTGTQRSKSVVRYASSGTGVTAPGTRNIPAGRKSYTVAVIAAASSASPTFDGVALPAGTVLTFSAESGDTLPSATLISVAGDDVLFTEAY